MNVQDIINAAADDADDYLSGVSSMTEARPAIREYLAAHYPGISATDSARIVAGVLAILDEEGFFEGGGGGGSRSEDAREAEDDS